MGIKQIAKCKPVMAKIEHLSKLKHKVDALKLVVKRPCSFVTVMTAKKLEKKVMHLKIIKTVVHKLTKMILKTKIIKKKKVKTPADVKLLKKAKIIKTKLKKAKILKKKVEQKIKQVEKAKKAKKVKEQKKKVV